MFKSHLFRMLMSVVALFGVLALPLATVSAADGPSTTVIASGLDNPRGLAFSPNGALYIAEAGTGGDGPCITGPEGGETCYGPTGAITRIWRGQQERFVTGLPSHAAEGGFAAIGPHDISFLGTGEAYVVTGLGADPAEREHLGSNSEQFARLIKLAASGQWRYVADLAAFEAENDPDGHPDTNPYAVLAQPGRQIIADAGANALLAVGANGAISELAVFPPRDEPAPFPPFPLIPMQAVPNAIAEGPDGAYYVGQLTGFPFPVDGANIYRVVPGHEPMEYATGFTAIIDLAFGADGSLYVLEIATHGLLAAFGGGDWTGALIHVDAAGMQHVITEDLFAPAGLAVGPDDALYVSNCGICPGGGEVLRIEP